MYLLKLCFLVGVLYVVMGQSMKMEKMGFGDIKVKLMSETGVIMVYRKLPKRMSPPPSDTTTSMSNGNTNVTASMVTQGPLMTPKTMEKSQTAVVEIGLKSLQRFDGGEGGDKMTLTECKTSGGGMMGACRAMTCVFGDSVDVEIHLCPRMMPSAEGFLLLKMKIDPYVWCNHKNQSSCPSSELMFTAEVLLPVGLNISKLEGQQKMASSNGSEAIDVLAYRIGSNTARFYVYSKFMEHGQEQDLRADVSLPKPNQAHLTLKMAHEVAAQNTSVEFHLAIDPGFDIAKFFKLPGNLATAAKTAVVNLLLVFVAVACVW